MKKLVIAALLAVPLMAQAQGDAEAGKNKAGVCASCHGVNGIGIAPMYPNLAGQKAAYLEVAIKAYRDGQRSGGNAAMMAPMVANLSDQDIADLAAYYANLGN
ncbi:MAG: cytochrome c [Pseudomonadales bacterium]